MFMNMANVQDSNKNTSETITANWRWEIHKQPENHEALYHLLFNRTEEEEKEICVFSFISKTCICS
jgi:hypothetical protein